ncbi:MAG: iron-sulfur cluster assembly scaffold protein [Candidatus Cloacimonetes bacterium]|nr:iron-sulfur cluster assembly scaffold protein [Candidatus Cloacimonadota bacterium]MBS3767123.1 iron-sulfur cluster assembly scaffold protein [Candidatus Cloacimonadota bacterium]
MAIKYSEKVIEHFKNPHNIGELEQPSGAATEGSPACGDQLSIYLDIEEGTNVIKDIKFQSYGCASNIATASIITDMAKGKTIDQAKEISWKQAAEELGGLPPVKMHCSVLAVDALRSAIKDYEKKHLGKEFDESMSKENVKKELQKIIYGKVGVDILTLKLVKYIGIDNDNNIIIDLEMDKGDKFLPDIKEEIEEHLSKFDRANEIKINVV